MSEKQNKKNNKFIILLLVIVAIFLVGGVGYIIGREVTVNKYFDEIYKDIEMEEYESDDDLLNENIKDNIKDNIKVLEGIRSDDKNSMFVYSKDIKNEDLSVSQKLYALLGKELDKHRNTEVTTDYDFDDGIEKTTLTQLEESDVSDEYMHLFGYKLRESNHQSFINECPSFIYDKKNRKYYGRYECATMGSYIINTFVNRITTKGDEAYAYVNFAVADTSENIVYADYERTKKQSDYKNNYENMINEDNYKEFSEYKYTFKKKNGYYYFVEIERLS